MRFFVFFAILSFIIAGFLSSGEIAYAEPPSAKEVIKGIADKARKVIERQEAKTAAQQAVKTALKSNEEVLDGLFAELRKQSKTGPAGRISKRIWRKWDESGSHSINLLMDRSNLALKSGRHGLALDLLDQVIVLAPKYAEGWNRRATVNFLTHDYGKSIVDIERTLALEPRHFGALAGLAGILDRLGRETEALETWFKVLEIYPAHKIAQSRVIALTEKAYGNRT